MLKTVNTALSNVIDLLTSFASQESLTEKLALVFGVPVTSGMFLDTLANLPDIEVCPDSELQGASGAFSGQTEKIYLSESVVKEESQQLVRVLLTDTWQPTQTTQVPTTELTSPTLSSSKL